MAMPRSAGSTSLTTVPPIDDLAVGDVFQPGDHPEQRRLPAAGRADEDDEFAVGDLEVGAMDDLVGAEALDDISQRNTRHCQLSLT